MAFLEIKNVRICGLGACVPATNENISEVYKWGDSSTFIETTGIKKRRKSNPDITSSDLCFYAAEKLIEDLGWDKSEIEALIFVSQTPDYPLPATSCILQDRLDLAKECYTLDISLGCSGWVYALSVITSLMQSGFIKKGLLLAGDTVTKMCSSEDKSTCPLFGDAGTATALEYKVNTEGFNFSFNADGKGFETIIVKDGGFRNPTTTESFIEKDAGEDIKRSDNQLVLDGMDVFSFGISKAPKSVKGLCSYFDITLENVDLVTFHQANMMMNEMIRKKLKLEAAKVPYSMDEFGNTSCASIPLTLVVREASKLRNEKLSHIACGFGVGLSWGSVWFETDKIVVPNLIEI